MIKRIIRFLYFIMIFAILYFPLIQFSKYLNIKSLFTNKEMISSILTSVFISTLLSLIIGVISIIISRYYFLKKKNIQRPVLIPLMIGLVLFLIKNIIGINNYILICLGYILLLVPIISYLEFNYLKKFVLNNKESLRDFGKVELLRIMDKSIVTYYFVSFIVIYGDNILASLLFDNRITILPSFIKEQIYQGNNTLIANSLFLSFFVILFLLLIVYMISYEIRLRGKYEKDN